VEEELPIMGMVSVLCKPEKLVRISGKNVRDVIRGEGNTIPIVIVRQLPS